MIGELTLVDLVLLVAVLIFAATAIVVGCVTAIEDLRVRQRRARFKVIQGARATATAKADAVVPGTKRHRVRNDGQVGAEWEPIPLLQGERPRPA